LFISIAQCIGALPEFIITLIEKIRDAQFGNMWIAETSSGKAAAAEILIWDHHMAYRLSAASHEDYTDTGATSLLLFEILTYLQKKGVGKYNMMAANTPHLAKFIASFNPELVPYYSVQKSRGILRILSTMRSIIR
jgi:lipid II:glycine glycyltransferase (peptidoglycan interpeptide bridge formation enzyme)